MDLINDKTGLPSAKFLQNIREWPVQESSQMMSEIKRVWQNDESFRHDGENYKLSVSDDAGNEMIVEALKGNAVFWDRCCISWRKGERYEFEIRHGW